MPDASQKEYLGDIPETFTSEFSEGVDGGESRYDGVTVGGGKARVFILLLVIAGLTVLTVYSLQWKKGVVVSDVVVEGVSSVAAKELASSLGVYKGSNLQDIDSEELKVRVMRFPFVRDAHISKELNGIVRIRVVERLASALVVIDGRNMAVDAEGFLIAGKKELSEQVPKLLSVSGISRLRVARNGLQQLDRRDAQVLRQFIDALSETAYARLIIREFHFEGNNMSYCIAAQSPTRFIVGNDGNFKEKLKKFEIFWQKVVSKKVFGAYETVDLRFRDRVFTTDSVPPQIMQNSPL